MNQETVEKVYRLVDEIKGTDAYKTMLQKHREIEADEHVQALIASFKKAEANYNEAQKYGKHHPNLKHRKQAFSEAKAELYNHPLVKAYKQAEKSLQERLDAIGTHIAASVSKRIRVDTRLSSVDKGGLSCTIEKV